MPTDEVFCGELGHCRNIIAGQECLAPLLRIEHELEAGRVETDEHASNVINIDGVGAEPDLLGQSPPPVLRAEQITNLCPQEAETSFDIDWEGNDVSPSQMFRALSMTMHNRQNLSHGTAPIGICRSG